MPLVVDHQESIVAQRNRRASCADPRFAELAIGVTLHQRSERLPSPRRIRRFGKVNRHRIRTTHRSMKEKPPVIHAHWKKRRVLVRILIDVTLDRAVQIPVKEIETGGQTDPNSTLVLAVPRIARVEEVVDVPDARTPRILDPEIVEGL